MGAKAELYERCKAFVSERINRIEQERAALQQSANEETKSSVGDKYETGRAMIQLELEKLANQLAEAIKQKQALEGIDSGVSTSGRIGIGSVVKTNHGNFYLAISAGQYTVDDVLYITISPGSPIGQKLIGLRVGDSFILNNRTYTVTEFF
jgi:transcription elongation GreA/GreB family factor